jgi:hypothetical protein
VRLLRPRLARQAAGALPATPQDAAAAETAALAYAALSGDLDAAASLLDDLG